MTKRISIRSTATTSSNGRSIRVRTTVSNGSTTRTTTKNIRVK